MPKKQNTVLSCLSVLFLSALSFLLFVTNVTAAHQRSDTSDTLKYLVSHKLIEEKLRTLYLLPGQSEIYFNK